MHKKLTPLLKFSIFLVSAALIIVIIRYARQQEQEQEPFHSEAAAPSMCSLYTAATATHSCRSPGSRGGNILHVNDPEHNLREIVKQLILIEDHLFQTDKQCEQCIAKHLLTVEAMAEEGISLDTTKVFLVTFRNLVTDSRRLQKTWKADPIAAAQHVRELRRVLMDKYQLEKMI